MWVPYRTDSMVDPVVFHKLLYCSRGVVLATITSNCLLDAVVLGLLGNNLAHVHGAVSHVNAGPVSKSVHKNAVALVIKHEMIHYHVLEWIPWYYWFERREIAL